MILALLFACSAGNPDSTLINEGNPYIELLNPVEGATVCGTPLLVEVFVANLKLVEPVEDVDYAESGTGHVDISLNGQDAAMVWQEHADISDVPDGEYQLKVELSNADHTAVEPYAGDLAYITVSSAVCGL
ncbi:MAG TPA: hypothetical protein PKY30_15615 [Myxococcota bacterium]|nr:hypothetical protein [Myxococcota bacterium]HNH48468.1 hypothetical protein [Myxococcota bacterium]